MKKNKVFLNEKVKKISSIQHIETDREDIKNKNKYFNLITNKNSYLFDIVIDASYDG